MLSIANYILNLMKIQNYTLGDYAELEGSELGDMCELLVCLQSYPSLLSDEFNIALEKEVKEQLENFQANTKVELVEHIVTSTEKTLVWENE